MTAIVPLEPDAADAPVGAPDPPPPHHRRPLRHRAAQRWPVGTFLLLALVLSWWPAVGRLGDPEAALVVPIGPSIAGLLVAGWRDGRGARRAILRSTVTVRGVRGWWSLGVPFLAAAGAVGATLVSGADRPTADAVTGSLLILAVIPLTAVVNGPLGEELGWRGFLLPHLLASHSPVAATLRLFPLWVLFHLPLVLTEPDRFGVWWLATVAGLSLSLTWLHLRSGGSVALAVVFHAVVNSTAGASIRLFDEPDQAVAWVGLASVWIAIAAVLLARPLRPTVAGWRRSSPVAHRGPRVGGTPRGDDVRSARSAIVAFLVLVALVAGAAQAAMLASGRSLEEQGLLVLLVMWAPGLAAVVVGRARGERLPPRTFRLGGRPARRWYAVAWLLPLGVGAAAYGMAWATGWATLEPDATVATVAVSVVTSLTLAVPISATTALGEELGWRGFLLPRLVSAGVAHPVAVSNGIWWLFHVPLVLGGLYASGRAPGVAAIVFGVTVTAVGSVAGWSRLATGSVWPAVLLHATWNAVVQGSFDRLTVGEGPRAAANLWVGESGLLLAAAAVGATVLVARWLRRQVERPEAEPPGEQSLAPRRQRSGRLLAPQPDRARARTFRDERAGVR